MEFADSMSGAIRNVQCLVNQTARQYPGPESWSRGILPIDGVAHLLLARIRISQSHVERQGSLVPLIHDVLLGVAYHIIIFSVFAVATGLVKLRYLAIPLQ